MAPLPVRRPPGGEVAAPHQLGRDRLGALPSPDDQLEGGERGRAVTEAVGSRVGSSRAWAVWGVGLSVYLLAVFHRSSLGVAGLLAADRFEIEATALALFTVLQLVVYAGMQIPVGVLLDRFGSRALLLTGLTLMTTGQLAFAFATTFPVGVAARVLLGAGDAMVFVSVIRLVAAWFRPRQAPFATQMTGQVGQLGAIAAAAPLALALQHSAGRSRSRSPRRSASC